MAAMSSFRVALSLPVCVVALVACAPEDPAPLNPFFVQSEHPLGMPAFDRIANAHFAPAFERGMEEELAEVQRIASNPEPPTLENTLIALERSGRLLRRVQSTFNNLTSAHTNDSLEAVRTEFAPRLSAHRDRIRLDGALFARIESIYSRRGELGLTGEDLRLAERYHTEFVRTGARLSEADKERLRAMNSELASLSTRFTQNVLAEVNDVAVVVDSIEQLAGLSEAEIAGAARRAEERGLPGQYVLPLLNTSGQPVLAALENRVMRRRIHETSLRRGSRGGEYDNLETVSRTMRLRAERARLLGYANHAAWVLEDETALTPDAVNDRLAELTAPAVANARREAARLQGLIDAEAGGFRLEPWDWAFYSEKLRRAEFAYDESELRPYFELDHVLQHGVFWAATQLYGITFVERTDLPTYQEDVRVFDVHDADGDLMALFLGDYFARPSKRGGAWASAYVSQSHLLDEKPVVANHLNIPEPNEGDPALLTFDEVTTLFHEFGHTLHAIFSDVEYPRFSGTSVPRDFVEFPSQVNEMWATWPQVVANYAVHYQTGAPMPRDLVDKVLAIETFNQGFLTTEYLGAALVDQALHQLAPEEVPGAAQLMEFETEALRSAGALIDAVPPRYHLPYFSHIFGGYAAGYYSYIWAEVLDADAVEWFEENGGLRRENGDHFRRTLLARGGSIDQMTLYREFRGRDPRVEPLLERRGLAAR